jgi:hypothetical protein
MGRLLKRAEEIRLVSDYHGASIDPEDARQLVGQAEEFIAAMRVLIEKPTV